MSQENLKICDNSNKIQNETVYIFCFLSEFCIIICKKLLFRNFAWFGCTFKCECLQYDAYRFGFDDG